MQGGKHKSNMARANFIHIFLSLRELSYILWFSGKSVADIKLDSGGGSEGGGRLYSDPT